VTISVIGVACASADDGKLKGIPAEWVVELAELADHVLVEADGAAMLPFKAPAEYEPVIPVCADLVIAVVGADAIGLALTRENVHRPERIGEITGLRLGEHITPEAIGEVLLHPSGIAKGAPEFARVAALINKVEDPDRFVAARQIGLIALGGGMDRVVIGHVKSDPRVLEVMMLPARVGAPS
jgi:probable selenium-dependent hydroxylase accessory protein YqeC